MCVIAKLEYGWNRRVHREAIATERSGEENPLGLHAKAGPDVLCAALDYVRPLRSGLKTRPS
ncbi:hypothetical protein NT26_p10047 (plasmid) [Pseudorhizobium banfieldiae]|uniref:Uncharacterized protein n=1 Tax=Pseudorhizobium banfieldiae TaxID=1125847 RepID=L0NNJ7_9HYPH|nr:hypothetical protein NT26_p10047 [Pseudorhizobium banfieldiae]